MRWKRDPARRRELVTQRFERVWFGEWRVVAVRPTAALAGFFGPGNSNAAQVGGVWSDERTGATGVEPGIPTPGRYRPSRSVSRRRSQWISTTRTT